MSAITSSSGNNSKLPHVAEIFSIFAITPAELEGRTSEQKKIYIQEKILQSVASATQGVEFSS
jgi:hypothetical protein